MQKSLVCIAVSAALTGCFGSDHHKDHFHPGKGHGHGHTAEPEEPVIYAPTPAAVNELVFLDSTHKPLAGAEVTITALSNSTVSTTSTRVRTMATTESEVYYTDAAGRIALTDLQSGTYILTTSIGGIAVSSTLIIDADNAAYQATISTPITVIEGSGSVMVEDLSADAVFATISGQLYDDNGPVAGAQIELSGGELTNGVVTSTLSDSNGVFTLFVGIPAEQAEALSAATIRIIDANYETIAETIDVTLFQALAGQNYQMVAASNSLPALYSENFEQGSNTCGNWSAESVNGDNANLWHLHTTGQNVKNSAATNGLVQLAYNDTSMGYAPEPIDSAACWYGSADGEGSASGNYLAQTTSENNAADGGTSATAHAGAIVSPWIDLTAEAAPLSVQLKTWWEIESDNPYGFGSDTMEVAYTTNERSWVTIARLNPLSNPTDGSDRSAIPFSNAGYNLAPYWQQLEAMDISEAAGESIKLRLTFNTQDAERNGFRGWLVDDISVLPVAGTFPRPEERPSENAASLVELYVVSPYYGSPLLPYYQHTFNFDGLYKGTVPATIKLVRKYSDGYLQVFKQVTVNPNSPFGFSSLIDTPDIGDDFDLSIRVHYGSSSVAQEIIPLDYYINATSDIPELEI
ncbi:SpaA isopeptide-forming pilin-related protein [Thalassolituus marinus]|uniref:Carboxypeptidase regulatory-like domain-containing protein n=1 Tax=Thalassolituus marinus TaxID=671053 RepID=A0ABS7ZP97_9GAMM|nr:SpaA isopeptide-forming pilin-related protein [Thalassolituus marinus]MCA6063529.1 hypothetical protein [Thalassolituus marinus]